jgi:hypothetical protein
LLTVLGILLSIYGLRDQKEFSIELADHLEETNQRLEQIESSLRDVPEDEASENYVVVRRVNLRTGPSTDFPVLRALEANTLVSVVETSGGWLRVDAFDFVEFKVHAGWVYKRYLQPLEP